MEISPKLLQPIPFYMTYPGYFGSEGGMTPSEDVVQLLLLNEVYKRRHGGRRGRFF